MSTEIKYSWPHWLNHPSGDFCGRSCVARTSSNLLLGGLSQCVHCKPSAAEILNRSVGTCPVWLGWKCQSATIQPVETTYGTNVKVNIYPWHRLNTRVSSVRLAGRLALFFFELHLMSHTWLLFLNTSFSSLLLSCCPSLPFAIFNVIKVNALNTKTLWQVWYFVRVCISWWCERPERTLLCDDVCLLASSLGGVHAMICQNGLQASLPADPLHALFLCVLVSYILYCLIMYALLMKQQAVLR